jgi:hypothetical protein
MCISNMQFGFCRKNQKSHVTTNLVHKLFRIQNIAPQPLSYFEGLVSPNVLEAARKKQAGKNRTWFTLTVEGLNAVLYQVMLMSIVIVSLYFERCLHVTDSIICWTYSKRLQKLHMLLKTNTR